MSIDPFTPAQELPAALVARTVGRGEVRAWLHDGCRAALEGRNRLHQLLVGGRGSGRSHLAQLLRQDLDRPEAVVWVGEDIPVLGSADALWERIPAVDAPRRVAIVEGLDRQLEAMNEAEQWAFRHRLAESDTHLVGTSLSAAFAGGERTPFFGQLDTWRLGPLDRADAEALFTRISGIAADTRHGRALLALAAGDPRAIVAFADASRAVDGAPEIAVSVHRAFCALAADFRHRFHALPPLGQRLFDLVALEPAPLRAGEVADRLNARTGSVSKTAGLLEADGLLVRGSDPADARVSTYGVRELHRYLYRYQTMDRAEGGLSAIGGLLSTVLEPRDLVEVWQADPRGAVGLAAAESVDPSWLGWRALLDLTSDGATLEDARLRCAQVAGLPLDPMEVACWMWVLFSHHFESAWTDLGPLIDRYAFARGLVDLLVEAPPPGGIHAVVEAMIPRLAAAPSEEFAAMWMVERILAEAARRVDPLPILPPLSPSAQSKLAQIPHLRALWSARGLVPGTPPLRAWPAVPLEAIAPGIPDARDLLDSALIVQDAEVFAHAADVLAADTPVLFDHPAPTIGAPDVVAAGRLLAAASLWTLRWAASFVGMPEDVFQAVLGNIGACARDAQDRNVDAESAALTALLDRAPRRFDALAHAYGVPESQDDLFSAVRALRSQRA